MRNSFFNSNDHSAKTNLVKPFLDTMPSLSYLARRLNEALDAEALGEDTVVESPKFPVVSLAEPSAPAVETPVETLKPPMKPAASLAPAPVAPPAPKPLPPKEEPIPMKNALAPAPQPSVSKSSASSSSSGEASAPTAESEASKIAARAARFGISPATVLTEEEKLALRQAKFGGEKAKSSAVEGAAKNKISEEEAKKLERAQRFGIALPTDESDKKPRPEKIGKVNNKAAAVINLEEEEERKRKRAERFAASASHLTSEDQERAKKRAARFGLPLA